MASLSFTEVTGARYRAMRTRFQEKRNKRGRVTQIGRELPFTLEQYRQWLLCELQGKEHGIARCCYCRRPIDIHTLRTDHRDPVSLGGSLFLNNMCVCCEPCNDMKGSLSADDFMSLLEALRALSPAGAKNVVSRLQKSEKLAATNRRFMAMVHVKKDIPRGVELTEDF